MAFLRRHAVFWSAEALEAHSCLPFRQCYWPVKVELVKMRTILDCRGGRSSRQPVMTRVSRRCASTDAVSCVICPVLVTSVVSTLAEAVGLRWPQVGLALNTSMLMTCFSSGSTNSSLSSILVSTLLSCSASHVGKTSDGILNRRARRLLADHAWPPLPPQLLP